MAREIKFRAWDERRGGMFSAEILEPDVFITALGSAVFPLEHGCDGVEMKEDVGISLMQYTGLRDMNGTEIYEGDVVQLYGDFDEGFLPYHKATVTFHEGCFCIDDALEYGNYKVAISRWVDDHSGEMNEIEVIGNIYEHADLLANAANE